MYFSPIILAFLAYASSPALANLSIEGVASLSDEVEELRGEVTNLRANSVATREHGLDTVNIMNELDILENDLDMLDVKTRSKWTGCKALAPFIITNLRLETHQGRERFYLWETAKTPNERWKFLHNFEFVERKLRKNFVWTEEMTPEEALTKLNEAVNASGKKILFVTHGHNADVEDGWCTPNKIADKSEQFITIPIIWKTDRGLGKKADYRFDRKVTAPAAGRGLASTFDSFFAQIEQPKSWMCHSMGCFVTRFFAGDLSLEGEFEDENNKFDDLFLVAPDLRYDFFNEWPIKSGKGKNQCELVSEDDYPDCIPGGADAFLDMVKNKVHVHFNVRDFAGGGKVKYLSVDRNWPISRKGLLEYGNKPEKDGGREPRTGFSDRVDFIEHDEFGTAHGYQKEKTMVEDYDRIAKVNNA